MYSDKSILLVEDNISDIRLMELALKRGSYEVQLKSVSNGDHALQYLFKTHPYEAAKTPDLIVLDLNIPGTSGKEILAKIKTDDVLKYIPVVVLSSSDYSKDVRECYGLHANCYLRKPSSLDGLSKLWEMIVAFWLKNAELT